MTTTIQPERISIDKIKLPLNSKQKNEISVLRLDKIHPVISGNKCFKLKYYLQHAIKEKSEGILTFGGAWSNHIVASAYAASLHDLKSIGIIRGEKPENLSDTLTYAKKYSMQLKFISRNEYKNKAKEYFLENLEKKIPGYYIIPEGGCGEPGLKGAREILDLVTKKDFSHVVCAIGTGTTFSGLANAATVEQTIIGIPVLKAMNDLENQLADFIHNSENRSSFNFFYDYHFGGYAKYSHELINFMNELYQQTGIPTDFVYTGKLFFAVNDLAKKDFFPTDSRILIVHSGGLQGNSSLKKGTLIF